MLDFFIPLLACFVQSRLWALYFIPIIALCFLATVPKVLRYFVGIGGR